jgi:hypothetical protein
VLYTSNLVSGESVPIPTLPELSIRIASESLITNLAKVSFEKPK